MNNPRIVMTFESPEKMEVVAGALRYSGADPVPARPDSCSEELAELIDGVDGLLLAGGPDIDPALYGQPRSAESDLPDRRRDELEIALISHALRKRLPILGLCRGLQIINVFFGGTLIQHMSGAENHHHRYGHADFRIVHSIDLVPGSRLRRIVRSDSAIVNSRHHQAVDAVGKGLRISARASDGTIEGLEHADYSMLLGVQWHPEDLVQWRDQERLLFAAFVAAATSDVSTCWNLR